MMNFEILIFFIFIELKCTNKVAVWIPLSINELQWSLEMIYYKQITNYDIFETVWDRPIHFVKVSLQLVPLNL